MLHLSERDWWGIIHHPQVHVDMFELSKLENEDQVALTQYFSSDLALVKF